MGTGDTDVVGSPEVDVTEYTVVHRGPISDSEVVPPVLLVRGGWGKEWVHGGVSLRGLDEGGPL